MKHGNVVVSDSLAESYKRWFPTERQVVALSETDLTDAAVVVLSEEDVQDGKGKEIVELGWGLPVIACVSADRKDLIGKGEIDDVITKDRIQSDYFARKVEKFARRYDREILPPFFEALVDYRDLGNSNFPSPGHHGGQYFRRHPTGRRFFEFYGENLFRTDLSSSDVALGDLLIHEGAPEEALERAAEVFHADDTWFVLNGTSSSNKVVLNALLAPGDVVLFDRNNHKSIHHGSLVMADAKPVYLETERNAFGLIGGIDAHCFDEAYIRERVAKVDPERAKAERPVRLAVFQLGTYDGTIYNARRVIDKIGHLCDYVLFDSAWVGYEQWIPIMKQSSPMLLDLKENDPGIIVTQSVHKGMAGFSQASQIHKKDNHIKDQARYCDSDRFNNAYMMHASTSPFYPMYASLDVNARIHADGSGEKLWAEALRVSIEARKMILKECKYIRPFLPPTVNGVKWEDTPTEEIMASREYFEFKPGETWHGFPSYREGQYFIDPMKFLLTTPGVRNTEDGYEYEDFGVPVNILANYLRTLGIIPEKCDLNTILFLITPAETLPKMQELVAALVQFEQMLDEDVPLAEVLPRVYAENENRYRGYTIRQLCQEMHDFYKEREVAKLQRAMFREETLPKSEMSARDANTALIAGDVELIPLSEAEGRIATEGALPYPPGIICVVPGEVWGGAQLKYFLTLEEGINVLPGFAPELQGVHMVNEDDGSTRAYAYVVKN
ncbi:MAG: ornithine decarboxylase [Dermabacter sp.]|uniref:ornithine decarboxylase n=1 Tax=Dermabacter hominis TaxID=36740 RepID=UPI0021A82B33|nr:ornithine decarboxylase [Dermabacter hominis]MCT1716345.1 ornithine decarboxylase [Dermabacter hominis]MCT1789526.1 ornithine decarboxylase [Dermabacter hominis]MDU1122351.1 ornithine decarboxylase [Dermabacter sp.]